MALKVIEPSHINILSRNFLLENADAVLFRNHSASANVIL
jgi:hypothetical protein